MVPFAYSGTAFLAFLLASLTPWILNRFTNKSRQISRAVFRNCDFLEMLLEKAIQEQRQVLLTTTNNKVYAGLVTGNFDPSVERKYLKIIPTMSGYRDAKTRHVKFTTDYTAVYKKLEEMPEGRLDGVRREDFEIIIPISQLQSINHFEPDAYELFDRA